MSGRRCRPGPRGFRAGGDCCAARPIGEPPLVFRQKAVACHLLRNDDPCCIGEFLPGMLGELAVGSYAVALSAPTGQANRKRAGGCLYSHAQVPGPAARPRRVVRPSLQP